jgi:hypothetical protein
VIMPERTRPQPFLVLALTMEWAQHIAQMSDFCYILQLQAGR